MSARIIGQAGFGASSSTSIAIVKLLRLLLALQARQAKYVWVFPFIRSLPFLPLNRERWRTKREIHRLLRAAIDSRRAHTRKTNAASHGSDLLGTMLDSNWDEESMAVPFDFAIYPPISIIPRVALKDCYVDHLFIPKGLAVSVHNTVIQHSAEMWGEDANEFNPDRFANGSVAACKHPMAFMPFSFGARACIGRVYSQVQAKIVVASLLQRFRWSMSPDYRHNPGWR
ncbi:cytokinin hydroxylase-like [Selaginella moellendorffii]|uniref:cytokinin hydroxylase-like n=1 Tax=Selaginella moellendorffii TaxID=88036 RepID=UPI000D1C9E2E|nr:cytokinin hydroxylase-like [Selaginella moellendorffii]|eukprot:XP_024514882.1 cytokinin hydroxylase-like [Selaginella moellendorffii]